MLKEKEKSIKLSKFSLFNFLWLALASLFRNNLILSNRGLFEGKSDSKMNDRFFKINSSISLVKSSFAELSINVSQKLEIMLIHKKC